MEETVPENKILARLRKELPIIFKLVDNIPKPKKAKKITEDDIDNAIDSVDLELIKPKRKIKVIHVVVVIGLLLLLGEDFFGGGDEVVEAPVLKPIKKEIPVKKENPIAVVPEQPIDLPVNEIKNDTPVADVEENQPSANLDDINLDEIDNTTSGDVSGEDLVDDTVGVVDENKEIDNQIPETTEESPEKDKEIDIMVDLDEPTVNEPEEKDTVVENDDLDEKTEEPKDQVITQLPDVPNLSLNENLNTDVTIDESDNKMTEMILKELEKENEAKKNTDFKDVEKPEDPPHYLSTGKNLVYNCVDGHWACVDDTDYKICQNHYAYNKSKSKPTSCFPERNYEDNGECSAIQQYKINTIVKTDFCN